MSRSFKKQAGRVDRSPWNKNQAARKIRRVPVTEEIADGKQYRKYYDPWKIKDSVFIAWTSADERWIFRYSPRYKFTMK